MTKCNYFDELKDKGYILIKSFYDAVQMIELNQKICKIIHVISKLHLGKTCFAFDLESEEINEILLYMQHNRRELIGILYDTVKTLPEFCQLTASSKHIDLAKFLRETDSIGILRGGDGIRIDLPGEVKYMAPWHQDYLTQFGSLDGLTFWAPLVSVTPDIGPLELLIGSHTEGPLPVFYEENQLINTAYGMKIQSENQVVDKYEKISLSCNRGDLLILDFKTIHRSGFNFSKKIRWTMQMRYFNFNEPWAMAKGWPSGLSQGNTISQVCPDLLIGAKQC